MSVSRKQMIEQSGLLSKVSPVLQFLNIVQLVFYIALLCLVGQGAVWLLAGAKRSSNFFYTLFQLLNKPWVAAARLVAPKQIVDHQVPFVAFVVLLIVYAAVTLAKIEHCVSVAMVGCK